MADPALLARIPLFAGLGPSDRDRIAALLQTRRYPRGEVIFHQDDVGSTLHIVAEGWVKIAATSVEGKQQTLAILGPGAFFGEMSLLDEEPRSADAIAMENCSVLTLSREEFLRYLQEHSSASLKLLTELCRRLRRADHLIRDTASLDVPGRLAAAILHLSEEQGRREAQAISIEVRLTQGELAELVGASRESVNKWLGVYTRQGLLRYDQGRLTVLNRDGLLQRLY